MAKEQEKEKKDKMPPAGTKDDVQDILGLFLVAFGRGVGGLHIHRKTIRQVRDSLTFSIENVVLNPGHWNKKWRREAATVLGWFESVGRLAAQIAMDDKPHRTVVRPKDFVDAFMAVKDEHNMVHPFGEWCS